MTERFTDSDERVNESAKMVSKAYKIALGRDSTPPHNVEDYPNLLAYLGDERLLDVVATVQKNINDEVEHLSSTERLCLIADMLEYDLQRLGKDFDNMTEEEMNEIGLVDMTDKTDEELLSWANSKRSD